MRVIYKTFMIAGIAILIIEFLSRKEVPILAKVVWYIYIGALFLYGVTSGILFLRGRGEKLFLADNKMSKEELEKYDKKALFRFTGIETILFSFITSVMFIVNNFTAAIAGIICMILIGVFDRIYSKKKTRFLKKSNEV